MKKNQRFIVFSEKRDCYFQMANDDFRFGTADYKTIGEIKTSKKGVSSNGFNVNIVVIDSNETFEVFSDWSALKLT